MKFLLGTSTYNSHIQNIALALHERSALGAYHTGLVDNYSHPLVKKLRHLIKQRIPTIDRQLSRRQINTLLDDKIHKNVTWELLRTLSTKLNLDERITDWFFDQSEFYLDHKCARLLNDPQFDAFFGVEYGCLSTLQTAKKLGKLSIVGFLSPHHSYRKHWVDSEYQKFPELLNTQTKYLLKLGILRDQRRDEEVKLADIIHTASSLTKTSLIANGYSPENIITVPLGSPPAISDTALPNSLSSPLKFIYAGPVSVRKGAHYLLDAWNLLNVGSQAELHLYGIPLLPDRYFDHHDDIVVHGSVTKTELITAYQQSAILVFPTLCDGFGMVVVEALANGLPVITTHNAGAADLIVEGKNGFLVPPGDINALAECLEWCIQHPQALLAMRPHALATARNWTWTEFRTLFREQLNERGVTL